MPQANFICGISKEYEVGNGMRFKPLEAAHAAQLTAAHPYTNKPIKHTNIRTMFNMQ